MQHPNLQKTIIKRGAWDLYTLILSAFTTTNKKFWKQHITFTFIQMLQLLH